MEWFSGRIVEFLRDASGRVDGFVLDGGEEVRCSPHEFNLVAGIVALNARIEITGGIENGGAAQKVLLATRIVNADSKQFVDLPSPVLLGTPGMPLHTTPSSTASLAHHEMGKDERGREIQSQTQRSADAAGLFVGKIVLEARKTLNPFNKQCHRQPLTLSRAKSSDAAAEIERAYDRLHRIQAILAYLNIMKRQVHGISQMHEEARHTYQQALAQHAAHEFEGARELATASRCLSRIVEGVVSRALRSDTTYPSLVPPPPKHAGAEGESSRVEQELKEVAAVLGRIHWVMEHGTLPLEDRAQVRKIAAWGDAFYQQARQMYQRGFEEDAIELAQTASAAASSAEHVCRNWYATQVAGSQNHMMAVDHSATV